MNYWTLKTLAGARLVARSTPRRLLGGVLGAALACWSAGCGNSYSSSTPTAHPESRKAPSRSVKTLRASRSSHEETVKAVGALAALDRATLSAKVSGRLESIAVDLGDAVRQGSLIAQIEPQDYQLKVQQAEALLTQARVRIGLPIDGTNDAINAEETSTVRQARAVLDEQRAERDRIAKLSEEGIISKSELETAESSFKVAQSRYQDALDEVRNRQATVAQRRVELEIARQQLADTAVRAPFDGTIQERRANLGEYLTEGTPLVTLVRMNPLRLRLEVAEREAPKIRLGQKVRLTVEGNTNQYTGEIKRLSPIIEDQTRMLRIEADVANPGELRPGSFARAEIIVNDKARIVAVPANAVVTFAGIEKVFVVQDGKAAEKIITTGRPVADSIEIIAGLNEGDRVILAPGNLQAGEPVQVME